MTVVQILPSIPTGQVFPEINMVVLVKGKRYQVVGFSRTTLNVLGEDGKSYKLSMGRSATVQPAPDQSWSVTAPEFRIGQVVRFVGAVAAKYPGLYVIIKSAGGSVNVAVLGGDASGLGSYVRVPSVNQIAVVQGPFQVA